MLPPMAVPPDAARVTSLKSTCDPSETSISRNRLVKKMVAPDTDKVVTVVVGLRRTMDVDP